MAKILLVDRDSEVRSIVCLVLNSEHTVVEASNGREGLSIFQSFQPDVVVVDLNIPCMSGFDFVHGIRASTNGGQVKILAISVWFRHSEKCNQMLMAGADLCLAKPVSIPAIKASVAKLLASTGAFISKSDDRIARK